MHKYKKVNIGIFGFGHMGQAIFSRLKKASAANLFIHSIGLRSQRGATCLKSAEELFAVSDIVFICIKPQDFYALRKLEPKAGSTAISIMAGVTNNNIAKIIKTEKIIRTMPNLALGFGQAVIGWHANKKKFKPDELKNIEKLFAFFGESLYFKNEQMLDGLTAVSGSGPAYVFLFADALCKAARSIGFDEKSARTAVLGTIQGSIMYLKNHEGQDPGQLIKKVRSKKGTTDAALKTINLPDFYKLWQRAIKSAQKRSLEFSSYEHEGDKK